MVEAVLTMFAAIETIQGIRREQAPSSKQLALIIAIYLPTKHSLAPSQGGLISR